MANSWLKKVSLQDVNIDRFVFCHSFWQYNVFSDFNSSIKALFWSSKTATLCSRHLIYSFFLRLHSFAASLRVKRRRRGEKNCEKKKKRRRRRMKKWYKKCWWYWLLREWIEKKSLQKGFFFLLFSFSIIHKSASSLQLPILNQP